MLERFTKKYLQARLLAAIYFGFTGFMAAWLTYYVYFAKRSVFFSFSAPFWWAIVMAVLVGFFYSYRILLLDQTKKNGWKVVGIGFLTGLLALILFISCIDIFTMYLTYHSCHGAVTCMGSFKGNFWFILFTWVVTIIYGWIAIVFCVAAAIGLYLLNRKWQFCDDFQQ